MGKYLDSVNMPDDLKKLSFEDIVCLSHEIREFLIEKVSLTGGHLASNLGVVEITLALHYVFSTPNDKIIWDVGHQSYVHKILTGRKNKFDKLRQIDGLSGFPKVSESEHDCFNTGHSSTSISAALGIAKARDIKKENFSVIPIIGDGALTAGMAFEALNDAGRSTNNLIVILNDNQMSIAPNVGGLSKYLRNIRTQPIYFKVKEDLHEFLNKIPAIGKSAVKVLDRAKGTVKYMILPGIIFEELGFTYLGPVDGHNVSELINVLKRAQNIKGPILIHAHTCKGKGYHPAETKPHKYHGVSPFMIETGEAKKSSGNNYSKVFGDTLLNLAKKDRDIVAITAAMPAGTGLDNFSSELPSRFFDVGIAEQHAVTFAGGIARNGLIPVFAVYSSFLQRAYDQVVHDIAAQNLHVIFGIDRAGIVGEDGETHQGIYDISYLSHIPNMTILSPANYYELKEMIKYAIYEVNGPVAIRYPRGGESSNASNINEPIEKNKGLLVSEGNDITLVAVGNMLEQALEVKEILEPHGISFDIINARFVKPIDTSTIIKSIKKTKTLITIEDSAIKGGFGMNLMEELNNTGIKAKIKLFGFTDKFVTHGSKKQLYEKHGLDAMSIAEEILNLNSKNRRFTIEKGTFRLTTGS